MKLEHLKDTWQSVKPQIESQIREDEVDKIRLKKTDIRRRLLKKLMWGDIFAVSCIVLMALSPVWSPLKLPIWWLAIFCLTTVIPCLYFVRFYRSIKAIDIGKATNKEILMKIESIHRLYRNIELATTIVMLPLLIWISLIPPFIGSWRMVFVWVLIIVAFTAEYLWYSSNIQQLNSLVDWENE